MLDTNTADWREMIAHKIRLCVFQFSFIRFNKPKIGILMPETEYEFSRTHRGTHTRAVIHSIVAEKCDKNIMRLIYYTRFGASTAIRRMPSFDNVRRSPACTGFVGRFVLIILYTSLQLRTRVMHMFCATLKRQVCTQIPRARHSNAGAWERCRADSSLS